MGEDKTIQGIFIPIEIWTIKNLSFHEKIILSDIHNKSQTKNFKGYNKKAETLEQEFGIKNATELFKTLQKKGYIYANSDYYREQGVVKRGLPNRKINQENLKRAERFSISQENAFLKAGEEGIYMQYEEIRSISCWHHKGKQDKNGKKKKLKHKNIIRFLILLVLIRKRGFYLGETEWTTYLFTRYSVQELAEFMGMTRQTIGGYLHELQQKATYTLNSEEKTVRLLHDLSNEEIYQDLYDRYGEILKASSSRDGNNILTVYDEDGEALEIETGNLYGLYFIDVEAMEEIGIYVGTSRKLENKLEEIYQKEVEEE